jgi:YVTN family beta-propeller protein
VFVANTSVWGGNSDSTVSVIDPVLDSVVATITVKKNPSSFAISNDGYLLIGCPGDETAGKIFKIDAATSQEIESYTVPFYGFGKDISVEKNSNNIFFISSLNDIVKYDLTNSNTTVVLSSVFPNNFYYGYDYDYLTKQHFVLDAKNFTVIGSLSILDSTYNVTATYQPSIAPRKIVFKYSTQPSSAEDEIIATTFSLDQNYPNPFNPSTKISWQSPVGSWQILKVYDALANEVETLVNEYRPAGDYSVNFDASNLSSGIYIYVLRVNDGKQEFTSSKKMTLIK